LGVRIPPTLPLVEVMQMEKLRAYYYHSKAELSKVIFPIKEQIRNAFISVFVVVTVISLFLALIDAIMSFSLSTLI
jgi:preprotein translocase subunit SecE